MIQIKHNRVLYLYPLVMNNTRKSEEIAHLISKSHFQHGKVAAGVDEWVKL